jgi:hypothetical protein
MCGILAVLGEASHGKNKRGRVLELSRRLKHRGPDWSGLRQMGDCYLSHQRLAIIDPASGDQPLYNEDQSVVVAVNGEVYNHQDLRSRLSTAGHRFRTGSDCEVIAHLVCLLLLVQSHLQCSVFRFGSFLMMYVCLCSTRSMEKSSWTCWTASSPSCCWTPAMAMATAQAASWLPATPSVSRHSTSDGESMVLSVSVSVSVCNNNNYMTNEIELKLKNT